MMRVVIRLLVLGCFAHSMPLVSADDWPMLGRDASRNAVSPERNPPLDWQVLVPASPASQDRPARAEVPAVNIRWTAELGINCHSTPVVSQGTVWIGTTDRSIWQRESKPGGSLRCFREQDGALLYQRDSPALPDRIHDTGWTGIGSSPLIEGDWLWYVTNRWEVVCLDIGPLLHGGKRPRERWVVDLIQEFGIFPTALSMGPARHCSIAADSQRVFVVTGNGINQARTKVPAPGAPALVCLDKQTGKTVWMDSSPGANVLLTEAASPLVAEIAGRPQVIVPQGDGWLRSFDPPSGKVLWQFDLNRKDAAFELSGSTKGFALMAPVLAENRIYVSTGHEAEFGEGRGRLCCIDPTKSGDISTELAVDRDGKPLPRRRSRAVVASDGERAIANPSSGLIWEINADQEDFEKQMHFSLASVAVDRGLVIATDFSGLIHCLDAATGKQHWSYDQLAACWSSPLIVGGHIYSADEDGDIAILRLSADPAVALAAGKPLAVHDMGESIVASPILANGTLYVATNRQLFAIGKPPMPRAPKALFVPTPPAVVAKMLAVAGVDKRDTLIDLGSGDGRILLAAAQTAGAAAIGYEIDAELAAVSREQVREAGLEKQVAVHEQDFYTADLRQATVVTAFLYPSVLAKLRPQFATLPAGTRIVTHTFAIPDAAPERVTTYKPEGSNDEYPIYLYSAPLRVRESTPLRDHESTESR